MKNRWLFFPPGTPEEVVNTYINNLEFKPPTKKQIDRIAEQQKEVTERKNWDTKLDTFTFNI